MTMDGPCMFVPGGDDADDGDDGDDVEDEDEGDDDGNMVGTWQHFG